MQLLSSLLVFTVATPFAVAFSFLLLAYKAFALHIVWNNLMPLYFNLPSIGFAAAAAVVVVWSLVSGRYYKDHKFDLWGFILSPLMAIGLSYLIPYL